MSSRYDSGIEAKIFLLTFSKFNKMTFLNFKLFWWILAIGWYVIIVVYHYLDDGCVFREANSHFMNHYYKKHYMVIIFCAKMSLIEINLAQSTSSTSSRFQANNNAASLIHRSSKKFKKFYLAQHLSHLI